MVFNFVLRKCDPRSTILEKIKKQLKHSKKTDVFHKIDFLISKFLILGRHKIEFKCSCSLKSAPGGKEA